MKSFLLFVTLRAFAQLNMVDMIAFNIWIPPSTPMATLIQFPKVFNPDNTLCLIFSNGYSRNTSFGSMWRLATPRDLFYRNILNDFGHF